MILDVLKNWRQYTWVNTRFNAGFEYLDALDPAVADGTYEIQGRDLYCMLQSFDTTPVEGHEFEAHREYADIQYVLEGTESILWAPREGLALTKPYTPDIEFFSLTPAPTDLVLSPGQFAVFMPDDAHAPCVAYKTPCRVRKAVLKVKL
ncbi:MAG: YhcH/YjgK/YiaL family protein [Candidatus Hydrogenedentes bacterium]|nr:YhcH/YjgK/YiaL family protein [Candidatus Hydrogenedentota bacterium]